MNMEKEDNPTNILQARLVERYWAEIDRRLGLFKTPAENLDELSRRVKKVVKDIPKGYVQELMCALRTKLRRISDSDVDSKEKEELMKKGKSMDLFWSYLPSGYKNLEKEFSPHRRIQRDFAKSRIRIK
ncbi:unnamed protein product [Darwinula stevensoni]|uniref:Uncharacterized protein n=1 Tax=Darwinula stevensoni TaxID=69355 RepID=A0A7R8XAJ5_9CRUS|nr:unnamed protein product [Darwinula stevensoni]CAG0886765.1 unnamed protein product [Darwinula stevensoni]